MRATYSWIASVALCAAVAGCGGSGDEWPELTVAEPLPPAIERAARVFWHGAAPLDLAWLDEHQRPPSRFDLEAAVDLVRPVPARIRDATTAVCAP